MKRARGGLIAILVASESMLTAALAVEFTLVERVAHALRPEFRQIESRLAEIELELLELPSLAPRPFASRYGFRSENLLSATQPEWLQLDLGRTREIDRVVAMPAFIPTLGERGKGYGFPRRFKIEISDDPDMRNAVTLVDRTPKDVPNPGLFPEDFRIPPTRGRYVRMTATRHFPVEDGFIWALEELLVLSGNQVVSIWNPVTASSTFARYPNWADERSQDGQSRLGMPVTVEPSPTRGYLSDLGESPDQRKWLSIDLGAELTIDQIRLLPVQGEGFEMMETGSFPRSYQLELARDPEFRELVWEFSRPTTNLIGFPGDCAVMIPVVAEPARYLRLVTLSLWGDRGKHGYGLAEIQAYSGDRNVALGRPVTVSDQATGLKGWSPDFVTDGFSSRQALSEFPEYLDLIAIRRGLIEERNLLRNRRADKLQSTALALGYGSGGLGGAALLGCGWLLVRQSSIRRRAVIRLREQIARDLHDDIGTNLGGIVLVSEVGSRQSEDAQAREDFLTIKEAAEQTSQSMQDIVWLIEHGNTRLRPLISRMRQATELILGEDVASLEVTPADFRDRPLSLFFRRHFFFAFKETLHNVRRHAEAESVEVRLRIDRRQIRFEVGDDGKGFDPEIPSPDGHGLSNLRRRAGRLKGRCHVESQPGSGTRVVFDAPFDSQS